MWVARRGFARGVINYEALDLDRKEIPPCQTSNSRIPQGVAIGTHCYMDSLFARVQSPSATIHWDNIASHPDPNVTAVTPWLVIVTMAAPCGSRYENSPPSEYPRAAAPGAPHTKQQEECSPKSGPVIKCPFT